MTEREKYDPAEYKPETVNKKKPAKEVNNEKTRGSGWRTFLIVIGIIALVIVIMIIGAIIALILIKPYGVDVTKLPAAYLDMKSDQPSSYDHPLLSTEQEKMLESLGIDTQTLPTQITPAQEQCAIDALGAARVNEIKAGAAPSLTDYLKAQNCF